MEEIWKGLVIPIVHHHVRLDLKINIDSPDFEKSTPESFLSCSSPILLLCCVYLFSDLQKKQSYAVADNEFHLFYFWIILFFQTKNFTIRILRNQARFSRSLDRFVRKWHFVHKYKLFWELNTRKFRDFSRNSVLKTVRIERKVVTH